MKKLLLAAAFATLTTIATAMAQPYPSRPITIIVPFPAGGQGDTLARSWPSRCAARSVSRSSSKMSAVPAAAIGTGRVARAAPDGYTMIIGNWTSFVVYRRSIRCSLT